MARQRKRERERALDSKKQLYSIISVSLDRKVVYHKKVVKTRDLRIMATDKGQRRLQFMT